MGDDRNGIVLGALEGSEISAIPCTDNPSDAYLDFIRYPNNVYRYADSSGNITWYHPSGMVINISTEAPPSPPSPMLQPLYNIPSPSNPNLTEEQTAPLPPQTAAPYVSLGHPSGTNVLVDSQGNITINGQNDASVTVKGTVTLNVQGNVSVQSSGSVQVSGSGNVSVQSSGGTVSVSGASSASVSASRINLLSSPSGSASIPVALMESAGPTASTLVFAENWSMTTVQWLTNAGGIPPTAAVVLGPDGNYYIADYNSPKWYFWDGQSGSSYTTTDMSSYTSYGFLGIEYSSVSGNNLTLIAHDGTILTNSSGGTGSWTASNPVTSGGLSWETCAGYSGGYLLSSYYGRIIDLSGTVLTTLTDWGIFRPFSSFVVIGSYAYLIAGVGSSQQLWAVDLSTGTPTKILSAPFINGISRNGLTCTLSDQIVGGLSSPTWMSFLEQQNQICVLEGTSVNLYNWGGSSPVATISPSTPTGTTLQKVFANENTIVIVGETSSTSFPVYFYTLSGGTWTNTGTITASSSVGWVEIQGSSAFILTSSNTIPVSYSGTSWTANASLDIVSTGNAVIDPTGNYAVIPTSSNLTSLLLTSTGWNVNGETPVSEKIQRQK
jgi:hypothetical protein